MSVYDILRIMAADKVAAAMGCPKLQLRRVFLDHLSLRECEVTQAEALQALREQLTDGARVRSSPRAPAPCSPA